MSEQRRSKQPDDAWGHCGAETDPGCPYHTINMDDTWPSPPIGKHCHCGQYEVVRSSMGGFPEVVLAE